MNQLMRIILLSITGVVLLVYLFGIVMNVFALGEMRMSNQKIAEHLRTFAGDRGVLTEIRTANETIAYGSILRDDEADSVAVVFVHGSPGSMDVYMNYLTDEHLSAHASLYTYDRLGYGSSTHRHKGFSLGVQSAQLHELVQAINARKLILVGHSLGCSIIGEYATEYPDEVDGLVMVAAPVDPDLEPSSWWRPLLNFPMVAFAIPHALRLSNKELLPLRKDLKALLPLWKNVHCPVTFIHGTLDNLVPVANVEFGKRVLVNAAPVKEVILEGKGHFILWTEVQLIIDEIIEVIER